MSSTGSRQRKVKPQARGLPSGLVAMVLGLIGLMTAFVIVATRWNDASGVAALGAVTSSIAAIVTGYFGMQYTPYSRGASPQSGRKRRPR